MKAGLKQGGFTIVETMIVLAVTGVLFLVAVAAVSGKQNETEFQQAINDIQNALQQSIAQINSGNYLSGSSFSCQKSLSGGLQLSTAASQEGSSTDCILIGKVLQFGFQGNAQEYRTYPIAALRDNNGDITTANPQAISPDLADNTLPNATTPAYLENGLTVASMDYTANGVSQPIGAVGFLSGLGSVQGGQFVSGAQPLYLVPIKSTALNADQTHMATDINSNLVSSYTWATNPPDPNYSVQICFASGTTNQSGLVTIGGNGGSNLDSITASIRDGTTC